MLHTRKLQRQSRTLRISSLISFNNVFSASISIGFLDFWKLHSNSPFKLLVFWCWNVEKECQILYILWTMFLTHLWPEVNFCSWHGPLETFSLMCNLMWATDGYWSTCASCWRTNVKTKESNIRNTTKNLPATNIQCIRHICRCVRLKEELRQKPFKFHTGEHKGRNGKDHRVVQQLCDWRIVLCIKMDVTHALKHCWVAL